MSRPAVFAECDDCGCTVAPSDEPIRPPGSLGGLKRVDGEWVKTVEVWCPSCRGLLTIELPEGVSGADVFGPAPFMHPPDDPSEGGGSE